MSCFYLCNLILHRDYKSTLTILQVSDKKLGQIYVYMYMYKWENLDYPMLCPADIMFTPAISLKEQEIQ